MKVTDLRFVIAGVEGGGDCVEGSALGAGEEFRAIVSFGLSPLSVVVAEGSLECSFFSFFEGFGAEGSGDSTPLSVWTSMEYLRFFSFAVVETALYLGVGGRSFWAYLSFRPSFFQAGMWG